MLKMNEILNVKYDSLQDKAMELINSDVSTIEELRDGESYMSNENL